MTTSETVERELRLVDDALRSGAASAGDPRELELQELALALAAEAPEPRPQFGAQLGTRVREGFPRERRRRLPLPGLAGRQALAVAAAAALALAVSLALLTGGDDETGTGGTQLAQPPSAADEGAGRSAPESARGDSALPAPEPGGGVAPGEGDRRIERSAALTLAAPPDRLDRVADEIVGVADRQRGFVLRSSVTSDEDGGGGRFELRIPNRRLQDALRELSALGEVRARTQSGEDVTAAFVSARDRLDAARAERRGLLRRLENAGSDREASALRRRIELVAAEIRGLRGQLRDLRERTSYAAVTVQLEADGGASRDDDGGGSGIGGAFDDALGTLSGSLELTIRALGVLLPLALLGALAWLTGGALRRRRREAALG